MKRHFKSLVVGCSFHIRAIYHGLSCTKWNLLSLFYVGWIHLQFSITLGSVYKQPKKLRTSLCCLNLSQIWLVLLLIRCLNFLITFVTHFENIRISNFYLKLGIYRRVIWQIRKRQGFYHCISIQTVWISRVTAKQTFDFWKICCLVPKHWTSCVA